MSVPSGPGDDAAIEEEAARAEIQRLTEMRGAGLAAEILNAWEGSAPRTGSRAMTQIEIAARLMRDYPGGRRLLPLLRSAVRDSCDLLVHAALLERSASGYAVSSGGEVAGQTTQLVLTRHGATLVASGMFGQSALSYLRDVEEQTHPASSWEGHRPGS